ncbi:uncharacterized protein LOC133199362 [Saccostrea echinata]|uniref:uncharacterized protein LOC133199362 n=1 Tax=Saccostrea echinata TaxID=191078 RepID=UPI002A825789|nr:uncharacterized protein LOC133199362 [Saccostrea echinata]
MEFRCLTMTVFFAITAVVGTSLTRDEEFNNLMERLLDKPDPSSLKDIDKRGWEPVPSMRYFGKRLTLLKRGWEPLMPLYRRRRPYYKRAWETHIVKLPRKRSNLLPFVDSDRFSDSVEPGCCSDSSACCPLCDTGAHRSVIVLDPSDDIREPCQCCNLSEICTTCPVMKK